MQIQHMRNKTTIYDEPEYKAKRKSYHGGAKQGINKTPGHRALRDNSLGNLLKSQFNPNEAPMDDPVLSANQKGRRKEIQNVNAAKESSKRNLGLD